MPLPYPVHAVILDMDGTLHDTEVAYLRASAQAAAALGFSISETFWHSLIGIPGRESERMLQDHMGPAFSLEAFNLRYGALCAEIVVAGVPRKPGAMELVEALVAWSLPFAVATSATRDHAELHLASSGLRGHIPVLVSRDDVSRGKPHPEPFLLAAERLGVEARNCVAVEDSFNGIRSAHAAGMMAILVPDIVQPTDEIRGLCTAVLPDLAAVLQLLREG